MRLGGVILLGQLVSQVKAVPRPQNTAQNGSQTNNGANSWKTMQCAQLQGDPAAEWKAANGDAAWNTTTASWRQLQSKGKAFPRFVSEFLHGPDGMRCSDFATENRCAMPVECQNNIIPAGYVEVADLFILVISSDSDHVAVR